MIIQTGATIHTTNFTVPASAPFGSYCLRVIANGIASDCASVAVTHKLWKELKFEIKEHKELIKFETEGLKLVFEDLRKISEGDWRERFGEAGWGEVIRQLVTRSDQIEGQLRSFIKPKERPETGVIPIPMPAKAPEAPPPVDKDSNEKKGGSRKSGRKG
jgi:hypothetical protein